VYVNTRKDTKQSLCITEVNTKFQFAVAGLLPNGKIYLHNDSDGREMYQCPPLRTPLYLDLLFSVLYTKTSD